MKLRSSSAKYRLPNYSGRYCRRKRRDDRRRQLGAAAQTFGKRLSLCRLARQTSPPADRQRKRVFEIFVRALCAAGRTAQAIKISPLHYLIAIIGGALLPAPDFQTTRPDTDHEPRNPARFPTYPHPCDRPARPERLGNHSGSDRTFRTPRPQPQS